MSNYNYKLTREAFRLFKDKKFNDAILLLENLISKVREDPYPFFLLSILYLLTNRFSEAEQMIKKMERVDPRYLPLIQLELFLHLKSARSINEALVQYIDKLEQFPESKYLKRALKKLRNSKDFSQLQQNAKLINYVSIPKPRYSPVDSAYLNDNSIVKKKKDPLYSKKRFKLTAAIISFFLILSGISYITYSYFTHQNKFKNTAADLNEIEAIGIDVLRYDLIDKIIKNKPPVFYYSNDEVLKDFNQAKREIKNSHYNNGLIILNTIENSNANFRVKDRAEFLKKFIMNIEDREYEDIALSKVIEKPFLYRGASVKWNGKIANLKRKEKGMEFNLLVNYKNDDIFSGIIDVFSEKNYSNLSNSDFISVNGVVINTIGADNRIYLTANDITRL